MKFNWKHFVFRVVCPDWITHSLCGENGCAQRHLSATKSYAQLLQFSIRIECLALCLRYRCAYVSITNRHCHSQKHEHRWASDVCPQSPVHVQLSLFHFFLFLFCATRQNVNELQRLALKFASDVCVRVAAGRAMELHLQLDH